VSVPLQQMLKKDRAHSDDAATQERQDAQEAFSNLQVPISRGVLDARLTPDRNVAIRRLCLARPKRL
jgi:hypothetical protein